MIQGADTPACLGHQLGKPITRISRHKYSPNALLLSSRKLLDLQIIALRVTGGMLYGRRWDRSHNPCSEQEVAVLRDKKNWWKKIFDKSIVMIHS
ncbi:MAG TPA: hypothetical protein DIW48_13200 [Sphaerochaeta sp.]|nr:hypothetical protein [Sphaerochaeta sp.]